MPRAKRPQPKASKPPANAAPAPDQPVRAIPIERPPFRLLRAYAFDPSLSTQLENASINHVTMKVPWEVDPASGQDILQPGPVG